MFGRRLRLVENALQPAAIAAAGVLLGVLARLLVWGVFGPFWVDCGGFVMPNRRRPVSSLWLRHEYDVCSRGCLRTNNARGRCVFNEE